MMIRSLKNVESIIKENKSILNEEYKVKKIGIFGSYIHGTQEKTSDIDILVEFFEPVGWEIVDLIEFLERILGLKVDLVTPNGLKPQLRSKILKDVVFA